MSLFPSRQVSEIAQASRSQKECRAQGKLARYAFLLGLLGGMFFFTACSDRKSSDLEVLPVDTYLQKPGDFLGNRYMLRVQINEQLKWEKGVGRVLAVVAEGSNARLPVFVAESAGNNLHVGQRYELQAIIEKGGLIYVEALQKY
tara:strand:- start:779 stop:1213 length:435 start_codon:yes stop_codon:yes gene_type:complete